MTEISAGIAFTAGILSFLSPCVLPLVPGYISFVSGISFEELKEGSAGKSLLLRSGLMSVFFVAGFSFVFVALGATASSIGRVLSGHLNFLTRISGIVIFILGIHLTGILKIPVLEKHKKINITHGHRGVLGAFIVGLAFAFGWTPCIGPVLAGMIALAASEDTVMKGALLLGVYSLGIGIPFIITGFAVGVFMRFFEKYRRFIKIGEILSGTLLIMVGALMFFDRFGVLSYIFSDLFGS